MNSQSRHQNIVKSSSSYFNSWISNNRGFDQPKSFISFSNKNIVEIRRDSKQYVQRKSLFTINNTNQSSIRSYQSDQSEILSYQGFGFDQEEENQSNPKNQGFEEQSNKMAVSDSFSNKANLADNSTLRSKQKAIYRKSWRFLNSSLSSLSPTINKKVISQIQHSQPNFMNNQSKESIIQNKNLNAQSFKNNIVRGDKQQEQFKVIEGNQVVNNSTIQDKSSEQNCIKSRNQVKKKMNNQFNLQLFECQPSDQQKKINFNEIKVTQKNTQLKLDSIDQISSNIKKDSLSFSTNKARISQQKTSPFIIKVKTRTWKIAKFHQLKQIYLISLTGCFFLENISNTIVKNMKIIQIQVINLRLLIILLNKQHLFHLISRDKAKITYPISNKLIL
ncbi:hypothetical protein ABPG72_021797 [Tetrahymena utriculariae]